MKKIIVLLIVAMFSYMANAAGYEYKTVKGDPTNTRIYTLPNGLKVYLSVNNKEPRVHAYIAVRTGSRNDPKETTGLAHYLEHIMFKGTTQFGTTNAKEEALYLDEIENLYEQYRKLTNEKERKICYHKIDSVSQLAAKYFIPNEYDKLMSAIGSIGTNAYTSTDVTCYQENVPANEIEHWAKIQANRFQNMVVRGFHTELEAVYEEKNMSMANDQRKVWAAINSLLFPTHPYGTQTTLGTQEHLKNPSIKNIKDYFNHYYVPNNAAICMAGDFNPEEVIAIIDKYFGQWKPNNNLTIPQFEVQKPITEVKDTTVYGQEAKRLMLGWRFNGAADAQNDTLNVLASMLANGKAGLFEVDLEHTLKVQGVGAFTNEMADYSEFIVYGTPKENQSLSELKDLIIEEFDKFKRGNFDENLLPSVINNMKLDLLQSLKSNETRVDYMVDAFINRKDWENVVNTMNRLSGITKQDIINFANKHFTNNYACVYKEIGTDNSQVKIEKPEITPIPTNRDLCSEFLKDIQNSKVNPIQPKFLDFKKDLTVSSYKKLPLLYKQNKENELFDIMFSYDFGTEDNNKMSISAAYLEYAFTKTKTATQIKQEFYKLACSYNISVGSKTTNIYLSGLGENMAQAINLLSTLLNSAIADKDTYNGFVDMMLKVREDNKLNQERNFSRLNYYATYGTYNPVLNNISEKQLRETDPQEWLNELNKLSKYNHTILYFGPMTEKELGKVLDKNYKTDKNPIAPPQGEEYKMQETKWNRVIIAPYDAKNIYLRQYHNSNVTWSPERAAVIALLNGYFGGGMNSIVFQELREARGLAYSASAWYSEPSMKNEPEYFTTTIISQNDKMNDCITTFNDILDNVPVSESAFNIVKQKGMKSLASDRINDFSILYSYLSAQKLGLDYDINKVIYEQIPNISLQDLIDFQKQYMANQKCTYIILGNEKELDLKVFEKIAPIERVTTEEIFGY